MNPLMMKHRARLMAPAEAEGADAGGTDTADQAVLDDDDAYMALSAEERRRLRGDDGASSAPLANQSAASPEQSAPEQAAAEEPEDPGEKAGTGIPRARFNEVNDRRKALESENEELRAQLAARNGTAATQAPAADQGFSIEEAEERYGQLMADGDMKGAAALRMQINAAIEDKAFERFRHATANDKARVDMNATVEDLLGQFPWLDEPEGAEALELIVALATSKRQAGMDAATAVRQAAMLVAPRFGAPAGVGQQGAPSGDIRTQRANQRGASHSMQQPPLPQAGMGNRATPVTVDTSKLSDDEYMALPEAERKKARGD